MRRSDGIADYGHEFEQALGDAEGQASLACCSPWGHGVTKGHTGLGGWAATRYKV